MDISIDNIAFSGDGREFLINLYRVADRSDDSDRMKIGEKLSEVSPKDLPDCMIFSHQRDLADYYRSIGRLQLALSTYVHGYLCVAASNYSYLKKWDFLLNIAEVGREIDSDEALSLAEMARGTLLKQTEKYSDLEGAKEYHEAALGIQL